MSLSPKKQELYLRSQIKYAKEISGKEQSQEVVDLFFEVSKREEFWFDLTSPRLYSLLLHNGPYRKVEIDLPNIGIITRLFKNIIDFKSNFTLMLQKSRVPQAWGVKGEAIVSYCEPLTTKEMRCPRLSRRVNNTVILKLFLEPTNDDAL